MIHFEQTGHIGLIRIDRPERMNCFDYPTLVELQRLVDMVRVNPVIRVVLFTGTGKAFSAGADLKERMTLTETEVRRNVVAIRDVFSSIAGLPQPTIAAVNGHALGGGFEWMLACDFRIIVKGALVGLTETSFGIIPGAGGTQRLPRLIGETRAKELIFTAKKIDAETAERYGIVSRVVSTVEELMEVCLAFADEMLQNGPVAIRQAKQAIDHGLDHTLAEGLKIETNAYEVVIPTEDRLEALQAFAEKRTAQFQGK
ncbi:enoyl-CoA hydratase-related protein [Exiguobacterium antarcticum]|uniref:Enoyl-CoA hydratase-related protein n=1 Tax=Exiguobacterium antarcticum TaxID=132920 RepID=A0ABT6R364_9BACL|nr:enoyl-CoA hydratase-related protein [Exiguobacterium antarcticum]AFS69535.1 enoyl-CoA hydratase/isomerase yngF [Exiguobacterium antarcticum B7]MDI3235386.1 enoyl-CoA hydratase-related protein [Exiguobacterium antarcticum]